MNLKVGSRLQAQPPARVSAERCFVSLIGYLQDASLLITTPVTSSRVRLQLLEDEPLVMRVFSNQSAFGFSCTVQRVCKLPYNYLHISYPQEVQGTVIRKAARIKTKIAAKIRMEKTGADLSGIISNLSANGALLDGLRNMAEVGDSIGLSFRFTLHNIEASLSVGAIVRTVFDDETLKQGKSSLAHFGLEFVDLKPNDYMVLKSMVYQQMIEDPQSLV